MIIPLLVIFYGYVTDSNEFRAFKHAQEVAAKIVNSAEYVYSLGKPSQATVRINLPSYVVASSLSDREVLFNLTTSNGIAEAYQLSSVNLTGDLPKKEGVYYLTLVANENGVEISYK